MADDEKKKSFWETLPGIITALAGLVTAVTGLVIAVGSLKKSGGGPPKPGDKPPGLADPTDSAPTDLIESVVGMKLVRVPGGCFMMGSGPGDKDRQDDEVPLHEVCVSAFLMGAYEVTQGQWQQLMGGGNPAQFKKGGSYPVESVSWHDAQQFLGRLNKKSGKSYRLPTEAEWEHACRAQDPSLHCGGGDLSAIAWHKTNSNGGTKPVGSRQANAFGLHDMSGNVWEWCADWYDQGYYASSPQANPTGPLSGQQRVFRGGGWDGTPWFLRAANRSRLPADTRISSLGFRVVLAER